MRKIHRIEPQIPVIKPKKKVAAYARVSMESERLMHSLSQQISYYSSKIQKNPDWTYVGVYADEGITGTIAQKRDEFQRMLADCEAGKIDIILTKSISRFARNTVDLLETVRHLRELGIEVRFEEQNINTMSGDGELMLTILASFAQEEVRSLSDNVKWATRKRFEQGQPNGKFRCYGYTWEGDEMVIVPEEAAIVKRIFQNFLDGKSRLETEREFAEEGITTRDGCRWVDSNIKVVLTNVTYTGNLLLQKEFIEDPITKKRKKNRGELPQYYVEDTHPSIIDKETFDYVQKEIARRAELGALANKSLNTCCFTSRIKCSHCGCSYVHNTRKDRGNGMDGWVCGSKKKKGGRCPTRGEIPTKALKEACAKVLGLEEFDEEVFLDKVDHIEVPEQKILCFIMKDGREIQISWVSNAKKDCWTDEKKEEQKAWIQKHLANSSDSFPYTTRIKCHCCGVNFRRATQPSRTQPSGKMYYWRCANGATTCGTKGLREDTLNEVMAEVLGLSKFDGDAFKSKVDYIDVMSATELQIHFLDGHVQSIPWKQKRHSPKWTEERRIKQTAAIKASYTPERRQKMSENMKRIRAEKYWSSKGGKANGKKSNSDSGNDQ